MAKKSLVDHAFVLDLMQLQASRISSGAPLLLQRPGEMLWLALTVMVSDDENSINALSLS